MQRERFIWISPKEYGSSQRRASQGFLLWKAGYLITILSRKKSVKKRFFDIYLHRFLSSIAPPLHTLNRAIMR
jgi:hypothetical protein